MVKLISKHNASLRIHLDKLNINKRKRITFLSHESQNKIIQILGELVRSSILNDIKESGLFSVIIDTTTDVANLEQFSFIVRYVNINGKIEERIIALETAADGTGMGLFNTFCHITNKYNINWKKNLCAQGYEGAASMQGEYSGLCSLIQQENSNTFGALTIY